MRLILVFVAFAPVLSWACGGNVGLTTSGGTAVVSFDEYDIKKVWDTDGMFVTHYIVAYCANKQSDDTSQLTCREKAQPILSRSFQRVTQYYKKDFPAEIQSSQMEDEEKKVALADAAKKAEYWAAMAEKAKGELSVEDIRALMMSEEFRSGLEHSYDISYGNEPESYTLDTILGEVEASVDDIPPSARPRCPRILNIDALAGVTWDAAVPVAPKPGQIPPIPGTIEKSKGAR